MRLMHYGYEQYFVSLALYSSQTKDKKAVATNVQCTHLNFVYFWKLTALQNKTFLQDILLFAGWNFYLPKDMIDKGSPQVLYLTGYTMDWCTCVSVGDVQNWLHSNQTFGWYIFLSLHWSSTFFFPSSLFFVIIVEVNIQHCSNNNINIDIWINHRKIHHL